MSRQHRSSRRRAYGRRQHEIHEEHGRSTLWRADLGPFWVLSPSLGGSAAGMSTAGAGGPIRIPGPVPTALDRSE